MPAETNPQTALTRKFVTDLPTMKRVLARLRPRTAAEPLSRNEWLNLPADTLERRTVTPLVRGVR